MKLKRTVKMLIAFASAVFLMIGCTVTVSAEELKNEVPAGVTVVKEGHYDGSSTTGMSGNDFKVSASDENPHWGDKSLKVSSKTDGKALDGIFWPNFSSSSIGVATEEGKLYYVSLYVYLPTAAGKVDVTNLSGVKVIGATTVQPGVWTKLSALYTAKKTANLDIYRIAIVSDTDTYAYVDDIVYAEIEAMPEDVAISLTDSVYDYEGGMTLTLTSNFAIDTPAVEDITLTNGAVATSVTPSDDCLSLTVEVDSLKPGTDYELTIANVKDVFGRACAPTVSFSTPAEFVIADVSQGVVEEEYKVVKTITNNTTSDISVGLVLASYNEAGELIDIDMQLLPLSAKGGYDDFTASVLPGADYEIFICNWETLVSLQ